MSAEPFVLENGRLRFELERPGFSFTLHDKARDVAWPCKELARFIYANAIPLTFRHCDVDVRQGEHEIVLSYHSFRYWVRWPEHEYRRPEQGPDLRFTLKIGLRPDRLVLRVSEIENLDDEEFHVSLPANLFALGSGQAGRFVLPHNAGLIYEFPCAGSVSVERFLMTGGFTLPCFAVCRNGAGLGAVVRDPFDCKVGLAINAHGTVGAMVTPTFVFEKRLANYPREIEIHPLDGDSHVHLAKRYRALLKEEGKFRPFSDKIAECPEAEKLVGAVVWKQNVFSGSRLPGIEKSRGLYTKKPEWSPNEGLSAHWTAKEIFDTAKARGFDRVAVFNTGWNHGGYDSAYPTRFPPNPERGTEEEFRRAAAYARSLSADYIYSVHDNYLDVYKNSPEWNPDECKKDANGVPLNGGVWRGGRAYLLCPEIGMRYAQRDLPRLVEMLGRGGIYLDVFGGVALTGCHDARHQLSKREEARLRKEIMRYVRSQIGSVATEYCPADYLAEVTDLGAFFPIHGYAPITPAPVPVPLYQLVYHDSVLNYTAEGAYGFYGSEYVLYVALFGLLPFSLEPVSLRMSHELRSAYTAEMTDHEFLTPAAVRQDAEGAFWTSGIQRTVFADGTEVVANFSDKPFSRDGRVIQAREFLISRQ